MALKSLQTREILQAPNLDRLVTRRTCQDTVDVRKFHMPSAFEWNV